MRLPYEDPSQPDTRRGIHSGKRRQVCTCLCLLQASKGPCTSVFLLFPLQFFFALPNTCCYSLLRRSGSQRVRPCCSSSISNTGGRTCEHTDSIEEKRGAHKFAKQMSLSPARVEIARIFYLFISVLTLGQNQKWFSKTVCKVCRDNSDRLQWRSNNGATKMYRKPEVECKSGT